MSNPEFSNDEKPYLSSIAQTAEDHASIGSTPPYDLAENPGKTYGDLMTPEDAVDWVTAERELRAEITDERDRNPRLADSILRLLELDLQHGIPYLQELGKLPDDYSK